MASLLKYASVAVLSSIITYNCSHAISYGISTIKFCNSASEKGFVPKDQAFSIRIANERSRNKNLETYLKLNDVKYEVFSRDNGLILGDARHNWSNFSDEEKKNVIASELYNSNKEKLGLLLNKDACLYILLNMPQKKRVEIINEFAKSIGNDELAAILGNLDHKALWDSIPNEIKKELLLKNLNTSTKKTVDEIKNLMKGFWWDYHGD